MFILGQELRVLKQEELEILQWISPLMFAATQKDTFERRQEGTGTWFLENQVFRNWKAGTLGNNKRTLYCFGMRTFIHSILYPPQELY